MRRKYMGFYYSGNIEKLKTFYLSMRKINVQIGTFEYTYNGIVSDVIFDTRDSELWKLVFIKRRFNTHIPHQKITTDTTEFKYYEVDSKGKMTMHKLYLDPFMDMFNGEIISYGIDKRPSAANVMNALNEAIEVTSDCPFRRTFHSDQGWAYQMKAYSHRLREEKIFQSMSRKGNCLDNSVMENFFGLLKQEIYHGTVYYSYEELKTEIEKYVRYYNEKRIKEKLGWLSPVQYRLSLLVA
jgi:putative transposase